MIGIFLSLSGWISTGICLFKLYVERREKRLERAAKEAAETELGAIKRRSLVDNPFFVVSDATFNGIEVPTDDPCKATYIPAGSGCLLCFMGDEVDGKMESGEIVYLLIENHGSNAYGITIKLDGEAVRLVQVKINRAHKLDAIAYAYFPERLGRIQTLEVGFCSATGVEDTHRYATKHGVRFLQRIDPACRQHLS
jgi:hypothetical protein